MRPLKFRAYDTKTKKYLKPWPEGFHLFGETTCFDLIYDQLEAEPGDRLLRFGDLIIEQFTGLHDKDGKEIYEGDVVGLPFVPPFGEVCTESLVGTGFIEFQYGQFVVVGGSPEPRGLVGWCQKSRGEYIPNYGNRTIIEDTTTLTFIGTIHDKESQ